MFNLVLLFGSVWVHMDIHSLKISHCCPMAEELAVEVTRHPYSNVVGLRLGLLVLNKDYSHALFDTRLPSLDIDSGPSHSLQDIGMLEFLVSRLPWKLKYIYESPYSLRVIKFGRQ